MGRPSADQAGGTQQWLNVPRGGFYQVTKGKAMAMTPQNNSIVQGILMGTFQAQRWMSVIHMIPIDPPSGDIADGIANLDEIQSILDDPADGWSFLRAVYTSTALNIETLQLQYVWPLRWAYKRYDATNLAGTQVGDAAPPNVSATFTFQSDNTGPHAHATMKIPGLLATDVSDGKVANIIRGHIKSEADFLLTEFTVTGAGLEYGLCVYNRADPAVSQNITHSMVPDTSRTMRRRTVGLGI